MEVLDLLVPGTCIARGLSLTSCPSGDGGSSWVNKHVEAFTSIGGAFLGVPKAISSLLSGEMRDTAEMNVVLDFVREQVFSRRDIMTFLRSFRSMAGMLPKGGNRIWYMLTPHRMLLNVTSITLDALTGATSRSRRMTIGLRVAHRRVLNTMSRPAAQPRTAHLTALVHLLSQVAPALESARQPTGHVAHHLQRILYAMLNPCPVR